MRIAPCWTVDTGREKATAGVCLCLKALQGVHPGAHETCFAPQESLDSQGSVYSHPFTPNVYGRTLLSFEAVVRLLLETGVDINM